MSVSISILEAELKLLSIARHALSAHMYEVIRCLAFKNQLASKRAYDPFFNLTLNAVELSIFADRALIDTVFGTGEEATIEPESSTNHMKSTSSAIEISEDVWIALQVEGHDEEGDETSGIRLRDISAPLAAAGISILFLSTYISDFILIKKHRLELVISILEREHFMSTDADEATSSQVGRSQSPYFTPLDEGSSSTSMTVGSSRDNSLPTPFPRSLTRNASTLSSSQDRQRAESSPAPFSPTRLRSDSQHADSRESSLSRSRPALSDPDDGQVPGASEMLSPTALSPTDASENVFLPTSLQDESGRMPEQPRSFEKMQESMLSESSTASGIFDKISLLPDETVCVGLSMAQETIWRSKIIHALFYTEDVLPRKEQQDQSAWSTSNWQAGQEVPSAAESALLTSRSSSNHSNFNPFSTTPTRQRPSIKMEARETPSRSFSSSTHESLGQPLFDTTEDAEYPTPFLSLTLTTEGGSLMTDIRLLRALFQQEDEHVIYAPGGGLTDIWSGELAEDETDSSSDVEVSNEIPSMEGLSLGRGRLPQRSTSGRSMVESSNGWEELAIRQGVEGDDEEPDYEKRLFASGRRLFKCLQLDLSSFGLEKAGLAHQFATLITKEQINLLYSATFRTANILVAKRHIRKARNALESASR